MVKSARVAPSSEFTEDSHALTLLWYWYWVINYPEVEYCTSMWRRIWTGQCSSPWPTPFASRREGHMMVDVLYTKRREQCQRNGQYTRRYRILLCHDCPLCDACSASCQRRRCKSFQYLFTDGRFKNSKRINGLVSRKLKVGVQDFKWKCQKKEILELKLVMQYLK